MTNHKRTRKEIYKERLEVYNRERHLITGVRNTLAGRSTVQLFRKNGKGSPRPVGNGVLFTTADRVFVLTAAHVIEEVKDTPPYLAFMNQFIELAGASWHTNRVPAPLKRENDIYDFGVMEVPGMLAQLLRPSAISISDLCLPIPKPMSFKGVALNGYPARNFRIHGSLFISLPTTFETRSIPAFMYQRFGRNANEHIVLEWFNTCFTPQGVTRSPSMAGLSGCGVWLIPGLVGDSWPEYPAFTQPKLMGIFTDHSAKRSALFATQVHVHIDSLLQRYPEIPIKRHLVRFHRSIPIQAILDPNFPDISHVQALQSWSPWYQDLTSATAHNGN